MTPRAAEFLWERCCVDAKAVLGDALSLLRVEGGAVVAALGPRARTVLDSLQTDVTGAGADLEAVEVYWALEADTADKALRGNSVPRFHGVGSDGVRYSVEFDALGSLLHVPLRLADAYVVPDGKGGWATLGRPEYTLGQVLYGVIHELTWHGTPAERDGVRREMEGSVRDSRRL